MKIVLSEWVQESAEEADGRERSDAVEGLFLCRKQPAEAIKANGECGEANAS